MNDSRLLAQGFSCYEQLKVMIDMNDFMLSAHGSRCWNNLELWMIWTTWDPVSYGL